jgi:hypothetical protein
MRVMRGERWAKLRRVDGVEEAVGDISKHVKEALIAQMRLTVKLQKLERAAGYDADIHAAIEELEGVGEALQHHFAVALARLPSTKRSQVDEVMAAAKKAAEA